MKQYPSSFQSDIIKRALGTKFDSFIDTYNNAKQRHTSMLPTDDQIKWAESAKKIGVPATCAKFKVANFRVYAAMDKVARHYWLNN